MYTLDTNAIIYYLNGDPAVAPVLDDILSEDAPTYISTITELELLSHSQLTEQDVDVIEALLASLVIMPVDSRIARVAGQLRRQYHIKAPDSAIAATALLTHTILVTRNVADFERIDNLLLRVI